MVKLKEQNINNRHTDFLPKLTFYIFVEEKLHSANWKQAFFALICIFFVEDEYPIYQQKKIFTQSIDKLTIIQSINK